MIIKLNIKKNIFKINQDLDYIKKTMINNGKQSRNLKNADQNIYPQNSAIFQSTGQMKSNLKTNSKLLNNSKDFMEQAKHIQMNLNNKHPRIMNKNVQQENKNLDKSPINNLDYLKLNNKQQQNIENNLNNKVQLDSYNMLRKDLFNVLSPKTKKELENLNNSRNKSPTEKIKDEDITLKYFVNKTNNKAKASNLHSEKKGKFSTPKFNPKLIKHIISDEIIESDEELEFLETEPNPVIYKLQVNNRSREKNNQNKSTGIFEIIQKNNHSNLQQELLQYQNRPKKLQLENENVFIPNNKAISNYTSPKFFSNNLKTNSYIYDKPCNTEENVTDKKENKFKNNSTLYENISQKIKEKQRNLIQNKDISSENNINKKAENLIDSIYIDSHPHSNINIPVTYHVNTSQNIIFSCDQIPDEVFFKDKRYIKVENYKNELFIENQKIKEEDREIKMVLNIMQNYIKIQQEWVDNLKKIKKFSEKYLEQEISKRCSSHKEEKDFLVNKNNELKILILKILYTVQLFDTREDERTKNIDVINNIKNRLAMPK
jgi:hypothetical protein